MANRGTKKQDLSSVITLYKKGRPYDGKKRAALGEVLLN